MQIVRWLIAATVFLSLLFLSLQNAEPVTLKFFQFASWQAPLVFVVFTAFAAGVAAGLLAGALRASRLKGQLNRLRREQSKGERSGTTRPQDALPDATGAAAPRYSTPDRHTGGL